MDPTKSIHVDNLEEAHEGMYRWSARHPADRQTR